MITGDLIRSWFEKYRLGIEASSGELNRLDAALGDGDFGASMLRGLEAVKEAFGPPESSPGVLLETAGSTIVSAIGGTSGPLVGSLFLRAGMTLGAADSCEPKDFAKALGVGSSAIQSLGGAALGDKTMLDALIPAVDVLTVATERGDSFLEASEASAQAAAAAALSTADLKARRGRASYTATGGLGHVDPGAQGIAIAFQALAAALKEDAGHAVLDDLKPTTAT